MGAPLKAGVLAGRSRDFALEIGSLMVSFQYYQLQSLIWSWLADKQAPLERISESLGSAGPLAGRVSMADRLEMEPLLSTSRRVTTRSLESFPFFFLFSFSILKSKSGFAQKKANRKLIENYTEYKTRAVDIMSSNQFSALRTYVRAWRMERVHVSSSGNSAPLVYQLHSPPKPGGELSVCLLRSISQASPKVKYNTYHPHMPVSRCV
jgi:hypothetical protein